MNIEMRKEKIEIDGKTYTVYITMYADGTGNIAIETHDEHSMPHCRLTTNPGYALDKGVIALRDDELYIVSTRDALIEAGIIEKLEGDIQIPMGWVTATLYRVIEPKDDSEKR